MILSYEELTRKYELKINHLDQCNDSEVRENHLKIIKKLDEYQVLGYLKERYQLPTWYSTISYNIYGLKTVSNSLTYVGQPNNLELVFDIYNEIAATPNIRSRLTHDSDFVTLFGYQYGIVSVNFKILKRLREQRDELDFHYSMSDTFEVSEVDLGKLEIE